eukprot:1907409-Amphidinium_carterae.1
MAQLSDAQQQALGEMDSDLLALLTERGVPQAVMGDLSLKGFKTLALFAAVDEDRPGVRAFAKADLALDPAARGGD